MDGDPGAGKGGSISPLRDPNGRDLQYHLSNFVVEDLWVSPRIIY